MDLAQELTARGLVEHTSADLKEILGTKRTVYFGVDPSADSMQAGNLVGVLLMKRLADAGHKIILLVGGGTGMIGDPREKGERHLLDLKVIDKNKKAIKAQMQQIIGKKVLLVDNADWLLKVKLFEFLRDIGKHFTVNDLIKRDIIKRRLDTPDESISFTEFTYALLQGYDYLILNQKYKCDLQIGGTDQWTNILSGVDLIRKKTGTQAFAFSTPLVTDANGKKFGKSEGNAVWLDARKTAPYAFYQFWLNQPDEVVERYLKSYTFMQVLEIDALCELHRRNPGRREAQKMLAHQVTEIVHGKDAALRCIAVSEALYGERELKTLSKEEQAMVLEEAPSLSISSADLSYGYTVIDALVNSTLATSKSEARRLIEAKGVTLNDEKIDSVEAKLSASSFQNGLAMLKRGKQICILTIDK
ncbi:MAG: tyrosine--tRNA ligase [Parcubacteria bacterium C7867-008]|nr:MAG: tyrosine--tRNA ligase [Parcubacteria bacterium C7867-008]